MVLIVEEGEEERREDRGEELSVAIAKEKPRRPPHNYVSIVKDAVRPIDTTSLLAICQQLYNGVLLHDKKQKYWVDKESNKNCFMMLARDLGIVWSGDERYWGWSAYKESDDKEEIEVAVLKGVCWLEIVGKFRTIALAPLTVYEVTFVVMMLNSSYRWDSPVNSSVTSPDGKKEERRVSLRGYPKHEWVRIPICEFTMSAENVGEMSFYLSETGSAWKSGIAVMGVSFHPKKRDITSVA